MTYFNECIFLSFSLFIPIDCAVIDLQILNKIDFLHGSVSIYHQNIQQEAIEMFKILKGVINDFIKGIFKLQIKCLANK